jgi:hypothetical protein
MILSAVARGVVIREETISKAEPRMEKVVSRAYKISKARVVRRRVVFPHEIKFSLSLLSFGISGYSGTPRKAWIYWQVAERRAWLGVARQE